MNDLAIPKTLLDYKEARDKAISYYKEALRYVSLAQETLDTCGQHLYPCNSSLKSDIKDFTKDLNRGLWRYSFDKTGLMQYMDEQARKEFNRGLEDAPPEFTIDNIKSVLFSTAQDAEMMFSRGIVNVFRALSDDHKTNTNGPFKINQKAVLRYMCEDNFSGGLRIGYSAYSQDKLNDIDRVIKVLDGKKFEPRTLESGINTAFQACNMYDDSYYYIKGFRNRNLHITFKRQDLLDKANMLIAKFYGDNHLVGHPIK